MLFTVGAQAFDKGDYVAALQAFEAAYRLTPRPGVLFSIAQAHRKQYFTAASTWSTCARRSPPTASTSARSSRAGAARTRPRRWRTWRPSRPKRDPGATPAAAGPIPQAAAVTRLMVNTQIAEAQISLDGAKPHEAPLVADVKPGKHNVRVTAPGYFDETRDVPVGAGDVVPVDVPLREKPGHLTLRGPDGAQVSIDGRLAATTPLSQPLDVPAGRHLVTVTRNGHRAYSHEIEVGRDEARALDVKLDATVQRAVSYTLMGGGAAVILAGAALAGVRRLPPAAGAELRRGPPGGQARCATLADCQQLYARYAQETQARDDFRRDAGIVMGAGALVGAVGLMLFAFDQPTAGTSGRRDDTPRPASPPRERSDGALRGARRGSRLLRRLAERPVLAPRTARRPRRRSTPAPLAARGAGCPRW